MKGLGEKFDDVFLVQKILRSLSDKFNPKVSAIEEISDLKTLSIDQLLGTLTAYEMRVSKDKHTTREASFKADQISDTKMEEFEAKFVRKLKTGSCKYKGKLPFKCFNCRKIGHFASKCPHKKRDRNHVNEEKHSFKRHDKYDKYKTKACVQMMIPQELQIVNHPVKTRRMSLCLWP